VLEHFAKYAKALKPTTLQQCNPVCNKICQLVVRNNPWTGSKHYIGTIRTTLCLPKNVPTFKISVTLSNLSPRS